MSNFLPVDDDADSYVTMDIKKNTISYHGRLFEGHAGEIEKENARRKKLGQKPMTIDETRSFLDRPEVQTRIHTLYKSK